MARQSTKQADPDVETSAEGEEVVGGPEASEDAPKAKAKKEPARGDLPEGYVTPVGLAKEIAKRGLQKTKDGVVRTEVPPQMVYSYQRNASKEDPFPTETVKDSLGHDRQALKLEDGIAWWERKNARAEERAANAKAKADKKAEADRKKAEASTEEAEGEASTDEAE